MRQRATKIQTAAVPNAAPVVDGSRFPIWLMAAVLALATILAYQPAWHAGFIWDDDVYVTNNPLLTAPDGLWRIWFSLDSPSQYFPLTYTALRLEHAFWGLLPGGYHLVNILLHAGNALLVWRLLQRLEVPGAWLAAAIFALHPVQVESVAWVTELKSVLSLFFVLLALLAWLEFIKDDSRPVWHWYFLALVGQALALTGKTTACTLPAALLLMLWLKRKPINGVRVLQVVPFAVMGLGMGFLTVWWERYHQGTQGKFFELGLLERLLVASHALWFYPGKLLWPANLMFSYPHWTINPGDPLAYGWLAALAGLAVVIGILRRFVGRGPEVAMLFYALTLSPLLGFIMLFTFRFTFVADHYQYVACIGPIALVAAGISRVLETVADKQRPLFKAVFCGALLLMLAVLTWQQCRMYASQETLWRATIERNPSSWMARINLGNDLMDQGQTDEPIRLFQEATRLNPDYPDAHMDLGAALLGQDRTDEAMHEFQEAIRLEPDYAQAHMNLGIALLKAGHADEAIAEDQTAIRLEPNYPDACYNLAVALINQGRADEAIHQFEEAIRLKPVYAEARNNLGVLLLQKGETDEAIRQLQEAVRLKPDYADAQRNLTTALGMKNKQDAPAGH